MTRQGPRPARPTSLVDAIHSVADCPCADHQTAFLDALNATEELLFKVLKTNSLSTEVQHPVGPGEQLDLEIVTAQGHAYLLAFPDLEAARRHDPHANIIGMNRDEALHMVLDNPEVDGLLVAAATDNDAWATAPRDSIRTLLSG